MRLLTSRLSAQFWALKLQTFLLLFPMTVAAQEYNSNSCPAYFDYIDFGSWNEEGEFTFSGQALSLGRYSRPGDTWDLRRFGCREAQKEKRFIDGSEVALVKAVEIYLPFPEIQELAHIGAKIRITRSKSSASSPETETYFMKRFAQWLNRARKTGDNAIEMGGGYTCLYAHDNPTLRGNAFYMCSIDDIEMDRLGTFVACGGFGGCRLYFEDDQGTTFDFEVSGLKWNTRFSHAKSTSEAVKLWSDFALDFHKNFMANTVEYGSHGAADKN